MSLTLWGWDEAWEAVWRDGAHSGVPVRVVEEYRDRYRVTDGAGEHDAVLAGRLRYETAGDPTRLPAVGDFVAAAPGDPHRLEAVLPRRAVFERKAAGLTGVHQVAAANIDVAFLVEAADRELSVRRVERYLTLAYDGGVSPVVVVNKIDRCDDPEGRRWEAAAAAPGVPVHLVSAVDGRGLEDLAQYLGQGATVGLLGLSGVGKSSLANALAGGALQSTGTVRSDDGRGRHTTTRRSLLRLPGGACLMDTPGMREMGMIAAEDGLGQVFADVAELAPRCRFADCRHSTEPGCAVLAGVDAGTLDPDRLEAWRKLEREMAYQARRDDVLLRAAERRLWARRTREYRASPQKKR